MFLCTDMFRCYICRQCGNVLSAIVQAGQGIADRDMSEPSCLLCGQTQHVEAVQVAHLVIKMAF
jgi:hypothetical protein